MKKWMQCICLFFTPSWIALVESAHLFRGYVCFQHVFFPRARDFMIFTLHSLTDFTQRGWQRTALKKYDHSCFPSRWPNSKAKLKWNHLWEQGVPLVFRGPKQCILSIGRIGSALIFKHYLSYDAFGKQTLILRSVVRSFFTNFLGLWCFWESSPGQQLVSISP